MKKLYALLIILIVIFIGINVSANGGFNILKSSDNSTSAGNNTTDAANVDFPKIDGFDITKINKDTVEYVDNNTGVTIDVQKIDNTKNVSDIYNGLSNKGTYSSSQSSNQNGVTTYFLYKESQSGYDTDIYFNKHNQNFRISGTNTTYENSDYFIKSCEKIIDSI